MLVVAELKEEEEAGGRRTNFSWRTIHQNILHFFIGANWMSTAKKKRIFFHSSKNFHKVPSLFSVFLFSNYQLAASSGGSRLRGIRAHHSNLNSSRKKAEKMASEPSLWYFIIVIIYHNLTSTHSSKPRHISGKITAKEMVRLRHGRSLTRLVQIRLRGDCARRGDCLCGRALAVQNEVIVEFIFFEWVREMFSIVLLYQKEKEEKKKKQIYRRRREGNVYRNVRARSKLMGDWYVINVEQGINLWKMMLNEATINQCVNWKSARAHRHDEYLLACSPLTGDFQGQVAKNKAQRSLVNTDISM